MSQAAENIPQPKLVEVYEGTSVKVFPAPLGKRAMALAVDYAVVTAVLYGFFLVMALVFGVTLVGVSAAGGITDTLKTAVKFGGLAVVIVAAATFILGALAILHGYFIYFEHKKGSTPGKQLFGLQVISATGGRLTMRQCVMREMFRSLLDVPLIFPGLISIFVTENKQRIGDLVAGTLVVHSQSKEDKAESVFVPQEQYVALLRDLEPQPLGILENREFLRYCNKRYISREPTDPAEMGRWEAVVRGQMQPSEMDGESLILFFAEFLYRTQE